MTAKANKNEAEELVSNLDAEQKQAEAALKETSKATRKKTVRTAKETGKTAGDATTPKAKAAGKRPDKATKLLKDAILKAAIKAGNQLGEDGLVSYLEAQALKNASSFLTLLGKVLPAELANNGPQIKTVTKIELVAMKDPLEEKASRKDK